MTTTLSEASSDLIAQLDATITFDELLDSPPTSFRARRVQDGLLLTSTHCHLFIRLERNGGAHG